jgi:hypothetical protein
MNTFGVHYVFVFHLRKFFLMTFGPRAPHLHPHPGAPPPPQLSQLSTLPPFPDPLLAFFLWSRSRHAGSAAISICPAGIEVWLQFQGGATFPEIDRCSEALRVGRTVACVTPCNKNASFRRSLRLHNWLAPFSRAKAAEMAWEGRLKVTFVQRTIGLVDCSTFSNLRTRRSRLAGSVQILSFCKREHR